MAIKGGSTLIRPDFEPSEDLEREEVERTEETSERSEVEPREEVLFKGMCQIGDQESQVEGRIFTFG